jgi:DNA-binding transcriptional LysR family regulator
MLATQLFEKHGLAPIIRLELSTAESVKQAILAGLGVAIMSRFTFGLDAESTRLRCLDVDGFPLENHWYFAYPVGKRLSATSRAFMDFARREARRLVAEDLALSGRRRERAVVSARNATDPE